MSSKRPESVKPTVSWIRVEAADVISALESVGKINDGTGRVIHLPGERVETFLKWARAALEDAETEGRDEGRHAFEAIANAKRALDRLFDLYLRRDRLHTRLRRRTFSEKLDLLKRRMGNDVPWRLIPTIVSGPRNEAEHEHVAPSVEQAGRAVEAATVVAEAMQAKSDPHHGPAFLGGLTGGHSSSATGDDYYWFHGFSASKEGLALVWPGPDDVVRVSVGRVQSATAAEVIYCNLQELSLDEHLRLLGWWDQSRCSSFQSEQYLRPRLELAQLDGPR